MIDDYQDLVHTGPGTLAGRYLRMFWQPVYRASDLPSGWAVPVSLLGEHFTLYRGTAPSPLAGERGKAHLVAFHCAHRGAQLSAGWVEGDCIRCRYHGWKYDSSGRCVEQPGEAPSFARKVRIASYPVQEYLGLLFVYLGEGAPPPVRRYPEFEAEQVVEVYPPDYWPCNYFNRLDNFCDMGHVAYTHRESARRRSGLRTEMPVITAEETEYGIRTVAYIEGEADTVSFVDIPNTNHLSRGRAGRPGDRLFWRVPVDDERCVSFAVERTHLSGEAAERYLERRRQATQQAATPTHETGMAVLAGRTRIEDIETHSILSGSGYTDIFWTEDFVCQVGQGTIADRSNERLGRVDRGVILLRKIWQRELKALAAGRPLKRWTCSAGLGDSESLLSPSARQQV